MGAQKNTGKPKAKKTNVEDEGFDPVREAKEIEALQDRMDAKKRAEAGKSDKLAGLKGVGQNNYNAKSVGQKSGQLTKEETVMSRKSENAKVQPVTNSTKEEVKMDTVNKVEVAAEPVKSAAEVQAARVQHLMEAEGKTMMEALQIVMAEAKPASTPRAGAVDRMAAMREENNIESLRKRIKIAFAKKSKGAGTAAEDRYLAEIQEGQKRLNELLADVNSAADPIARAMELGEAKGTILQSVITQLEKEAEAALETIKLNTKLSAKALKDLVNSQSTETPDTISNKMNGYDPEFLAIFTDRARRSDQRCMTLNKRYNLIESYVTPATEEPAPEPATPGVDENTEA